MGPPRVARNTAAGDGIPVIPIDTGRASAVQSPFLSRPQGAATTISAIVPVLDEAPTLRELHQRLSAVLAGLSPEYEVIFVNDGSSDSTMTELRAIAAADPRAVIVDLRRNFGKSAALAAGFAEASGDVLVTIDADLQDVPEEISLLIARLREGADVVTGRKTARQDPLSRRLASTVFNRAVSLVLGIAVRDINSGLKVLRRDVVREIPLHGDLHRFLPALAAARGFRVVEVDVAHQPRRHGRSRYGLSRYVAGLLDPVTVLMLTRFGKRPLHFFGLVGGAMSLVGGAILAWLAGGWFFGHWIGHRPLLSLGMLLVILGIQSLFFGLLAELILVAGGSRDCGYSIREVVRHPTGAALAGAPAPTAASTEARS